MLAVATKGGRIRPRVALVKSLASALCIGSGGSAGREGPIVQIGSALGSSLGQLLRLPESRIRLLVACGAAGGIAATFNAPMAGVIFALEVILREFEAASFGFVVFSSVTAAAISRAILGDRPSFFVPPYRLVSAWELPLYLLLGLIACGFALLFVKALYGLEDLFGGWRFREYLKPVAGGLLVGALGVAFPQVLSVGYGAQPVGVGPGPLDLVLLGKVGLGLAAGLALLKILSTSLTIGSGGSGGVFAPSLYIGAMLGGAFGALVHQVWPQATGGAGAYALVGMGAVFAGAARAPITAVLILFEMTGDYHIILPLMTAVVASTLLSQRLSRETIYTMKIRRRGIDLQRKPVGDLLGTVTVAEVMSTELDTVPLDLSVAALADFFRVTGHHGAPVVNGRGELVAVVTLSDLEQAAFEDEHGATVADIATFSPVTCHPDQTVREAMAQLGGKVVGRLPVVDRLEPTRLLGVLRRENVVSAYSELLHDTAAIREASAQLRLSVPGLVTIQATIPEGAQIAGHRLREISLPTGTLLVAATRGAKTMVPKGELTLAAGDEVTALAVPAQAEPLRNLLTMHEREKTEGS